MAIYPDPKTGEMINSDDWGPNHAQEVYQQWLSSGAPDYNNPGSSIYDTPVDQRSTQLQGLTPGGANPYMDAGTQAMQAVTTPPAAGVGGLTAGGAVTGGGGGGTGGFSVGDPTDNFNRVGALLKDPRAALDQLMKSMGIDPYGAGPMANYLRSQASLVGPAYQLWQRDSPDQPNVAPADFLNFLKQFFVTQGGNLGGGEGGVRGLIQNVLGMGGGEQNANWREMLNSMDTTDEQRQNLMSDLFNIGSMGSTSPFTRYRAANVGRLGQQYAGQYGMGSLPEQGTNPLFMDYIRQNMPSIMGW